MHSVTLLWLALSSRNDIEFFSGVDVGLHDLVGDGLHWEIFAGDVWYFEAIIPREFELKGLLWFVRITDVGELAPGDSWCIGLGSFSKCESGFVFSAGVLIVRIYNNVVLSINFVEIVVTELPEIELSALWSSLRGTIAPVVGTGVACHDEAI